MEEPTTEEETDMGMSDWINQKLNQGSEGDRADYESRSEAKDPVTRADQKTKGVMARLSAQRGANRTWGKPDPTDESHENRY